VKKLKFLISPKRRGRVRCYKDKEGLGFEDGSYCGLSGILQNNGKGREDEKGIEKANV